MVCIALLTTALSAATLGGIEANSRKTVLARPSARMQQLTKTINANVSGDNLNFDFVPGIFTLIAVNGAKNGTLIEGADFYNAVLKIFIGDHPVDDRLRAGLLGN